VTAPARATRGTSNRNARGSSYDRRARKRFLLDKFGDGESVWCYRCPTRLTFDTVTVDRIIPGRDGGTYRRDNIRPACAPCNSETGGKLSRNAPVWLVILTDYLDENGLDADDLLVRLGVAGQLAGVTS
jgi:5-methylcytosine-specific restriction endonuclease McrA